MAVIWLPWLSTALVSVFAMCWSYLACNTDENRRRTDITGAALIAIAWHPAVWIALSHGYADDSIYNLSVPGRVGLLALSSVLVLFLIYLSQMKSRWLYLSVGSSNAFPIFYIAMDVVLSIVLVILALTLVPQVYYTYYHLIFDLPQQWVIRAYTPARVWQVLQVAPDANLGIQAAGLVAWWLMILAVLDGVRNWRLTIRAWYMGVVALIFSITWHRLL